MTNKHDGDFAALILAGNKLLDTIDAYDTERELLFSNHPDVHAFSTLLDKMPPADMQAAASGELEQLRAALREIYEMWAGSEGFIPHTAPEGYLLMLVKKMADRAALEGSTV